jgi:hypothetical protein
MASKFGESQQIKSVRDLLGPNRTKALVSMCDELQECVSAVVRQARPWGVFVKDIKPPMQWDRYNIELRICSNLLYFRSNYFMLGWAIMALGFILNPTILLVFAIVSLWYIYVMLLLKGPIMVGDYEVEPRMKLVITTVTAVVFFVLTGALETVLWSFVVAALICLVHMIVRSKNHSMLTCRAQEDIKLAIFTVFIGGIDSTHPSLNTSAYYEDQDRGIPLDSEEMDFRNANSQGFGGNTSAGAGGLNDQGGELRRRPNNAGAQV